MASSGHDKMCVTVILAVLTCDLKIEASLE